MRAFGRFADALEAQGDGRLLADEQPLPTCRVGTPERDPELRAELESALQPGETLTDFVEATVRSAIAFRRVQTSFHARAQAASEEYHRTGVSVPVEAVLERLQSKLDDRRNKLGR
jgi:hypothetical protein